MFSLFVCKSANTMELNSMKFGGKVEHKGKTNDIKLFNFVVDLCNILKTDICHKLLRRIQDHLTSTVHQYISTDAN